MQNKKKCGKLCTHKKNKENSPLVKKKEKENRPFAKKNSPHAKKIFFLNTLLVKTRN